MTLAPRFRRSLPVLAVILVLLACIASAASAAEPDGKAVFMAQKCNLCHSVETQGIDRTVKTSKAKDLSNAGAEHKGDWIQKWLKKEEMIDGKKHQKTFTGSDAELAALVQWVQSLKK